MWQRQNGLQKTMWDLFSYDGAYDALVNYFAEGGVIFPPHRATSFIIGQKV